MLSSDTKNAVSGATANIKGVLQQTDTKEVNKKVDVGLSSKPKSQSDVTSTAPYDRCKAQLFAIQSSSETYLSDPKGLFSLSLSSSLSLSLSHNRLIKFCGN